LAYGEDRAEEAEHPGGRRCIAVEKAFDETREDGGDHAESEHVEGYGEEDESGSGAAAFGGMRCKGFVFSIAEANEFGLGEERVGRGNRRGRVLGRIRHVLR
jgi:hypothetical protein